MGIFGVLTLGMKMDKTVAAIVPGTLPMGGMIWNTPIFAVRDANTFLCSDNVACTRRDFQKLDLEGKLAFTIDNVLSVPEAKRLIHLSEELGFRAEAPGINTPPGMRMNKSVHWIADSLFMDIIFHRISSLLPKEIDGTFLIPKLSQRINMYRYNEGDVFNKHIDGDWPGYGLDPSGQRMTQWPSGRSKLTMLLYLSDESDGVLGGDTILFGLSRSIAVKPLTGRALFFRHGGGGSSVMHIGSVVGGSFPKYVARVNIMYK